MPRTIPIALQEHLDGDATTTCTLLRVDPVMPGIPSYGAALLDQPVTYDDGNGELVYQAIIGAQPSAIIYSSNLSVDGGDATNLLPEFDFPISEADIMAGAYDFAQYTLYLVNYADLSQGHVLLSRGTLGRFYVNNDGLSFTHEMRSLAQALKQSITEKWSIGCRATFGSYPDGTFDIDVPIDNPTFTSSAADWTLAKTDGAVTTTIAWSATGGRSDAGSINVAGGGIGSSGTITSDAYAVSAGQSITATAWVRTSGSAADAKGRISLRWLDGSSTLISQADGAQVTMSGASEWKQVTVTSTSPGSTASVQIRITLNPSEFIGGSNMYADDVAWNYVTSGHTAPPGSYIERFPCLYPADDLWEPGTVTSVGLENNQSFTPTAISPPFGGNPGKVRWLTGANASRENEVGQFDSGGIGLTFPTAYPIQVGDTFLFRDDCPKTPEACKIRDNWEHYRGEPNIPVGDAGQIAVPGASAGIGTGGRLTVGSDDDA